MEFKFYKDEDFNFINSKVKKGLIILISLCSVLIIFNALMFIFANRKYGTAFLITTIVVDVLLAVAIVFFSCYLAYFNSLRKHFSNIRDGEETKYEKVEVTDVILMLTSIKKNLRGVEIQIKIQKNKTKSIYFSEFYLEGVDIDIGKSYTFIVCDNFVKEFITYDQD